MEVDKQLIVQQTHNLLAMVEGMLDEGKRRLVNGVGQAAHVELLKLERRMLQRSLLEAQGRLSAQAAAQQQNAPDFALLALQINAMEAYDNALAYRIALADRLVEESHGNRS